MPQFLEELAFRRLGFNGPGCWVSGVGDGLLHVTVASDFLLHFRMGFLSAVPVPESSQAHRVSG